MHPASMKNMGVFIAKYVNGTESVLDVGAMDINDCGNYGDLFKAKGCKYLGLDTDSGKNVDVLLFEPYKFPFPDEKFDIVVSGQAFEHIEFFWLTFLEMVRVLKKGGLIWITAPSVMDEHRFPVDCWRFFPDGMDALAKWGKVTILEKYRDSSSNYWDCIGIFRK